MTLVKSSSSWTTIFIGFSKALMVEQALFSDCFDLLNTWLYSSYMVVTGQNVLLPPIKLFIIRFHLHNFHPSYVLFVLTVEWSEDVVTTHESPLTTTQLKWWVIQHHLFTLIVAHFPMIIHSTRIVWMIFLQTRTVKIGLKFNGDTL